MISFELAAQPFADSDALKRELQQLATFAPRFVSLCTYQPKREQLLRKLDASPLALMPHLSCTHATETAVFKKLKLYQAVGINQLFVMRGDVNNPSALPRFQYASELLCFINEHYPETFNFAVTGYPEGTASDFDILKLKLSLGASCIITQACYNLSALQDFCSKIQAFAQEVAIFLAIMPPPGKLEDLQSIGQNFNIHIPAWLIQAYNEDQVETAFFNFCQQLPRVNFHLFSVTSRDAAKISRLLKVLPRV